MRPSRKMTARSYSWTICSTTKDTSSHPKTQLKIRFLLSGPPRLLGRAHSPWGKTRLWRGRAKAWRCQTVWRWSNRTLPKRPCAQLQGEKDSVSLNVPGVLWKPHRKQRKVLRFAQKVNGEVCIDIGYEASKSSWPFLRPQQQLSNINCWKITTLFKTLWITCQQL